MEYNNSIQRHSSVIADNLKKQKPKSFKSESIISISYRPLFKFKRLN